MLIYVIIIITTTNKMNEPTLTTAPLREIYHRLFIRQCLRLVAVRYFRGKS